MFVLSVGPSARQWKEFYQTYKYLLWLIYNVMTVMFFMFVSEVYFPTEKINKSE